MFSHVAGSTFETAASRSNVATPRVDASARYAPARPASSRLANARVRGPTARVQRLRTRSSNAVGTASIRTQARMSSGGDQPARIESTRASMSVASPDAKTATMASAASGIK